MVPVTLPAINMVPIKINGIILRIFFMGCLLFVVNIVLKWLNLGKNIQILPVWITLIFI
jgi:hypothetical protein